MDGFPHIGLSYIDSPAALEAALRILEPEERLYLDLEADSMHHYFAKICLFQILAGSTCLVIDPLAGLDLKPLLRLLGEKTLVMHGSDYDLRMLHQSFGFRPKAIFDTQIAAQLLGKTALGLAALVQSYFGITLRKEHQKADWSLRPLTPEMIEYGAIDTLYLPGLYQQLSRELREKDRLDWAAECCGELIKATQKVKEVDVENAWRVDGSSRFSPRQLNMLRALWLCRDAIAQKEDLPSFRILPTDVIFRIAVAAGGDPSLPLVPHPPSLPSRLPPAHRQAFLDAWAKALDTPEEDFPAPLKIVRKPAKSPNAHFLAHLKKIRDDLAARLELDPSLLATRSTLTNVALSGGQNAERIRQAAHWMKWQEDLLLGPWLEYPALGRKGS